MRQFQPSSENRMGRGLTVSHLRQVFREASDRQVRMGSKAYRNVRCWGGGDGFDVTGTPPLAVVDGVPILIDDEVSTGTGVYEEFDSNGLVSYSETFGVPECDYGPGVTLTIEEDQKGS